MEIIGNAEIARIEQKYQSGLPARAILDIFKPKGVRLSEATFRKYVQAGLLPRSRRVGRKGKHRGSQGLYPVESVRRIATIKEMMDDGKTIDEIKRSIVSLHSHLEPVKSGLENAFEHLEKDIAARKLPAAQKQLLKRELSQLKSHAEDLVKRVTKLGQEPKTSKSL